MLRRVAPFLFVLAGCGGGTPTPEEAPGGRAAAGPIRLDGSSTVFPIAEAVAEEFQAQDRSRRVTIGVSGTGGGMKKFCGGEVDIAGASRPIKASEVEACAAAGVEFVELPVAYDGIALVVNPAADWVDAVTVQELDTIWEPEAQAKVTSWAQVRPGWPDRALHLFGPGVDSGTYDYFTQAVVGTEHASRGDFTSSEDDNVLVQGVATDPGALGFFGLAYYLENRDKLKVLGVDDGDPANGEGPVVPTPETVANGTYQPLSRPLLIYVRKAALERPEVQAFLDYWLGEGTALVADVGFIPLPPDTYGLVRQRLAARTTGSLFGGGGSTVGVTVRELLQAPVQ